MSLIRWLGVRRAALVELVVVALPLLALPGRAAGGGRPADGATPRAWLLGILALTVGAPFVALATATPTLQRWLAATGRAASRGPAPSGCSPASNAGSLVGLLAYPTLIEPNLDLDEQARLWAVGYVVFVALVRRRRGRRPDARAPVRGRSRAPVRRRRAPTRSRRLGWVGLAAVPAALVDRDHRPADDRRRGGPAAVGRPLAVYLATFVLAFAGPRPIGLRVADALLPPLALGVVDQPHRRRRPCRSGRRSRRALGALACAASSATGGSRSRGPNRSG